MLIIFLEKALTLIHIETHVNDDELTPCSEPFTLLSPHHCKTQCVKPLQQTLPLEEFSLKPNPTNDEFGKDEDVQMKDATASSKLA